MVRLRRARHDIRRRRVLAASRGPGWRILRSARAAVWLYLGFVATLVLPHDTGSWDYVGGIPAVLVGLGFALAAWRGVEQREPDLCDREP